MTGKVSRKHCQRHRDEKKASRSARRGRRDIFKLGVFNLVQSIASSPKKPATPLITIPGHPHLVLCRSPSSTRIVTNAANFHIATANTPPPASDF